MPALLHKYVIIGGGIAGDAAIDGIRECDREGSILMMTAERHLPYHRPPLSKYIWSGESALKDIFVHTTDQYAEHEAHVLIGTAAVAVDPVHKIVTDNSGREHRYEKLLLATGSRPQHLTIPGAGLPGICYFRTLDDYLKLSATVEAGTPVLIIGGGFIGPEMATAMHYAKAAVTILFQGPYLGHDIFPESLGRSIGDMFAERGIGVINGDEPVSIERVDGVYLTRTRKGREFRTLAVIVAVGTLPEMDIASKAGLETGDGIRVNDRLRTSAPDVYAAGDNCLFPHHSLGKLLRDDHWDNALNQGRQAGRNMAGADEAYTYAPYFFADLFDFGYQAVGDISTQLETVAKWEEENRNGVVYYLDKGRIRGAMLCGMDDKLPAAREWIRQGLRLTDANATGRRGLFCSEGAAT